LVIFGVISDILRTVGRECVASPRPGSRTESSI